MEEEVKHQRRRGQSRLSAKHQVTIPVDALRTAGLQVGDRLIATADGAGRIVLERAEDPLDAYAGALTGLFTPGHLDQSPWR